MSISLPANQKHLPYWMIQETARLWLEANRDEVHQYMNLGGVPLIVNTYNLSPEEGHWFQIEVCKLIAAEAHLDFAAVTRKAALWTGTNAFPLYLDAESYKDPDPKTGCYVNQEWYPELPFEEHPSL